MSDKKTSSWDKVTIFQKIKSIKHIELIIIAIFVLILGVIYITSNGKKSKNLSSISELSSLEEYGDYLENKLKNVIDAVEGAGNSRVMITFDGRITYEYATESEETTTTSSVTSGTNTKTVINEKVIIVTQNGKSTPLIVREIYPNISGVVVVSGGADNVAVKLDIISAVKTLLGVSDSQIEVLKGSGT